MRYSSIMKNMVCYYHNETEAVGQCAVCGKGLCKNCFDLTVGHWCYDCTKGAHYNAQVYLRNTLIWTIVCIVAVIAAIILYLIGTNTGNETLTYICFAVWGVSCIFPAWKFLYQRRNPDGTTYWVVWGDKESVGIYIIFKLLVLLVKFIIALFVSIIMPIVYIVKLILALKNYNSTKKDMELIEANHQSFVTL